MTLLWRRVIRVQVAGLLITTPKIEIDIKREVSSTPVSGAVGISNLSADHERQIHERGRRMVVEAGHNNLVGVIFDGVLHRVEKERNGLVRTTRISLGGMAVADGRHGEVITLAYDGEVPLRTIATDIVEAMQLRAGPLDALPEDETRPWVFSGSGTDALDQLVRGTNLTWYDDDGTIRFNREATPQPDGEPVLITPETGLVESPTVTDEGVRVRTLLNPRLRLGGTVQLRSRAANGDWKIVELVHVGDNWTGAFRTELDLRPMADEGAAA